MKRVLIQYLEIDLDSDQQKKLYIPKYPLFYSKSKKVQKGSKCKSSLLPFDGGLNLYSRGINAVDPCKPDLEMEQPRVVIVGAGMAGIAAAYRLSCHGIDNFVMLEATERPGGRINSRLLGDMPVELGAGYKSQTFFSHPVFDMCTWPQNEDPPHPGLPVTPHTFGLFDHVNYGKASRPAVISAYYKFRQIEKETQSLFCYGASKTQGSLVDFMGTRIQQDLHEYPDGNQYDAARIMFGLAHVVNTRCPTDHSWIVEDNTGVFLHMPGSYARVPLGLFGILAPMLQKIPPGNIRYCKPVNCIYWGTLPNRKSEPHHRALVTCCDGDNFEADYVIFTASVGVLGHNHNLFCPALPYSKLNAIHNLGMCHCNKIYLEFSQPFQLWLKISCTKLNFSEQDCAGRCDWTRGIIAIEAVPNSVHILCAWVTGPEAAEMEILCERDIAEGVRNVLAPYAGSNIPYPSSVLRSNWSADQFFLGAGSRVSPALEECQKALAKPVPGPGEPIPPILLFAGEATAPGLAATVAGAKISGIREADRIMQLTYEMKGRPENFFSGDTPKRRKAKTCNY